MKIFIDSSDPVEIKIAWDTGVIDGVTTNPSLATKAGMKFAEAVKQIFNIVDGDISLEVLSTDFRSILKEAHKLAALNKNVVVKVPMSVDGIKAVKALKTEGIRTNVTLVFSAGQALLAGKAGAYFVSPFIGRLDDITEVGMNLVSEIREIYDNYDISTQILVASDRTPRDTVDAALIGADIITTKFENFNKLFHHPLTDIGLRRFMDDWKKSGQSPIV